MGAGPGLGAGLAANHALWDINCTEGRTFNCGDPPFAHGGIVLSSVGGGLGAIIGAGLAKAAGLLYIARADNVESVILSVIYRQSGRRHS